MMLVAEHGQFHCSAGARSSLFYGDDAPALLHSAQRAGISVHLVLAGYTADCSCDDLTLGEFGEARMFSGDRLVSVM